MRHYKVKFIDDGELHYGYVDYFSPKAKEVMSRNLIFIEDAILPQTWEIQEDRLHDLPFDNTELEDYIKHKFEIALEVSRKIEGVQPGKLVNFPVGRGQAYYVVIDVGEKYATLQWRGFDIERNTEIVLGYEGFMNKQRLDVYLKIDKKLDNIALGG